MKHLLWLGLAFCCLAVGCQSEIITRNVSIDVKDYKTDYTISNVTFTPAKKYNKYKEQYSDPALEVCVTVKNNKEDKIAPLFKDVMERIRLFQRGVECDYASPLFINGEIVDYDATEKYILPGRSFKACRGFKLNSSDGLVETTFYYTKQGENSSINHTIADAWID